MPSIADGLPADVAARVHPAWRANEAAYWAARENLKANYEGQWVAFAGGAVVAAGNSAVDILRAARQSGLHPFVIRVGAESEPCRMRLATFAYDASYPNEPLPRIDAEFRPDGAASGAMMVGVIPDTGADASALPWSDCQALGFDPSDGVPGLIGGVGGSSAATLAFVAWVQLDGREYLCRLQADFASHERILGRDVLNRVDVLFRGPSGEVIINP